MYVYAYIDILYCTYFILAMNIIALDNDITIHNQLFRTAHFFYYKNYNSWKNNIIKRIRGYFFLQVWHRRYINKSRNGHTCFYVSWQYTVFFLHITKKKKFIQYAITLKHMRAELYTRIYEMHIYCMKYTQFQELVITVQLLVSVTTVFEW